MMLIVAEIRLGSALLERLQRAALRHPLWPNFLPEMDQPSLG